MFRGPIYQTFTNDMSEVLGLKVPSDQTCFFGWLASLVYMVLLLFFSAFFGHF